MKISHILTVALFAAFASAHADSYADTVVSYVSGSNLNTNFETPGAALGAPTTGTDGSVPYGIQYPAYKNSQIVGVGTGGELTLGFNTPITNDPADHAFGMDFTIFGNEFFTSGTNGTYAGTYDHPGLTVWVSQNNINYYELKVPDGYGADDSFPEQASGNPLLPVNPELSLPSFYGLTEAQALSLYNGSAGGASFSISWAVDAEGHPVDLSSISYVKIEGPNGVSGDNNGYVDAVAAVETVPEPSCIAMLLAGAGAVFCRLKRQRSVASA